MDILFMGNFIIATGELAICMNPGYDLIMNGRVVWITGLPGSGKSTVADALRQRLPSFIIVRMDDLRAVVTPQPTYSETERDMVYRSLVFTARTLSDLGHDVIIDATGNLRRWRELARKMIPLFGEVYLRCSLDLCRQREAERVERHGAPEYIYQKGAAGAPVPGVNVPYEEPLNPEVIIDMELMTAADAAERIVRFLEVTGLTP